jgi:hypothetical protein
MNKNLKFILVFGITLLAVAFRGSAAWAISTPAANSFLYNVYDIFVVKMAQGAAMAAVGVGGICVGAYYLFHSQWGKMVGALVGTGMMIAAPSIVTTLGMTF